MDSFLPYDSVQLSEDGSWLVLLDQSKLPGKEIFLHLNDEHDICESIISLKVRGAPAIGIAAAYGVCVSLKRLMPLSLELFIKKGEEIISLLVSSRPTAVNLEYALKRMHGVLINNVKEVENSDKLLTMLYQEADSVKREDVAMCRQISLNGFTLLKPGMGVLTHCNA